MAREVLDTTGNDDRGTLIGRINAMFAELYGAATSATSTVAGLITGGSFKLDTGTKTAAATAGAATLNKSSGIVTSEALTTAAAANYTLTITNSAIAAADIVLASVAYGTATAGTPVVSRVTPGAGSVVIVVKNDHASAAFDGTIKVAFAVLKA
jgi:hypothetical protein